MRLLPLLLAVLQSHQHPQRSDLRAGLDTIYAGAYPAAVHYFEALAAKDTLDAAPLIFQASAYIWWAEAKDSDRFQAPLIDSLLDAAVAHARADSDDFWLGTALGYRARQKELHGHGLGAAKDAKAMREAYARVLAADSTREDCYLGLGLYEYGFARVGGLKRFVAKVIGLGSGNADTGIVDMRRATEHGDLARVEATWVLAAALMREAGRKAQRRDALRAEARDLVQGLAARYPGNAVFQRFLAKTP